MEFKIVRRTRRKTQRKQEIYMDGQDDQDEVREENKPQMTQINADNIVMSLRRSGGGDLTPERLKQSGGGQDMQDIDEFPTGGCWKPGYGCTASPESN